MLETVSPQPGSGYLDVGSGNGAATIEVAARWQLEATGVDLDPGQIALARAAGRGSRPVDFVEADARRLPFADGTFDLVTSSKATHHIPEWENALAEMCRVLRPGGHLVYTDIALPRPLAWVARRLGGDSPPSRPRWTRPSSSSGSGSSAAAPRRWSTRPCCTGPRPPPDQRRASGHNVVRARVQMR